MFFRDRKWESCRLHADADIVQGCSHRTQVAAVGAVLILSVALAVASISTARSQSFGGIQTLQGAFAELALRAEQAAAEFREQIAALQTRAIQQKATTAGPSQANATQGALDTPQGLAGATAQREAAHALVADMQHAMTNVENLLETVSTERAALQRQLRAEARLAAVSGQGDGRRQLERGLQRQLEHLENELARLRAYRDRARLWLEAWVLDSARALEDLVGETGIDVEELIARAADEPVAQGGPLQVAAPDEVGAGAADDGITGDIERLALLQRIATTLPLAAPLDRFTITGEFGKRRDPFTRSWAYHAGLDLGAPRGAKVLAPAPGRVIFAGPSGPYGNLVEIDHGMGIVTRYAHLKSVAVAKGEEVALRTPIGVIGSTGRSTSRHLHYEVRIDDKLLDPARFLDAGRQVASVVEVSDEKTK